MNKDINTTLYYVAQILWLNGEKITGIEAVEDWYDNGKYMKEVAEITYEDGHKRYADIDGDSNLAAVYDIVATVLQMKPRSSAIETIKRDVYPKADIPKHKSDEQIIREYERDKAFAGVFGF